MSAIATDAPFEDIDQDAFDAFLGRLVPEDAEKKAQPSAKTEEADTAAPSKPDAAKDDSAEPAATEEKADAPAEEPSAETEETEEQSDAEETKYADDGAYVKIKVGDEEHEVPVKELQRLYGQEKALTQKSMETAELRKTVDAKMAENVAASTALLERARARFEPYSKIDFLLAAKELSTEDYTNLRQAATAAWEDVQFLEKNVQGFMQQAQARQHEHLVNQAKESLKVLAGPVDQGGIEGFNENLYNDIRKFGAEAGLSQEILHNLVDPVAIRLLNSARLYELGKKATNVVTTKVNKTPKKIVKTSRAPDPGKAPGSKTKEKAAAQKLRVTGDTDDAAEAMLARWGARDADLD